MQQTQLLNLLFNNYLHSHSHSRSTCVVPSTLVVDPPRLRVVSELELGGLIGGFAGALGLAR